MRSLVRALTDRRGVALPLALFALVIAAVMITAVFYVGRLEQRMGNNSVAATRAFEAAETGLTAVMNNWDPMQYNTLPSGGSYSLPTVTAGQGTVYNAIVRRLNNFQFLIQSEGRFLIAGAVITRRQVAQVVRIDPPLILPEGAVINRTGLTITGSSTVDGTDQIPTGWSGCTAGADAPAVVDSTGLVLTTGSCAGQSCLTGSPKVETDAGVNSVTFQQLGALTYNDLAQLADKTVTGTVAAIGPTYDAGPTCRMYDPLNWGAPEDQSGPCGQYFPVIYAPGDLDLAGGTGQGLLLVDGNLTFSGNVRFYGVIVVNGSVNLGGGEIHGTIFVRNESGIGSTINGTRLEFSRCAISRASSSASVARPLKERSWAQLY